MKERTIQFLIEQKEYYNEQINSILYDDLNQNFKSLSFGDLQKIDNLRKQIHDIYDLIDILNEKEID